MEAVGRHGQGVVVLGTHRSGTSALTGVLAILGLPSRRDDDAFPVRRFNARGNFESRSLAQFDEVLLGMLGGNWQAPADPAPGWVDRPPIAAMLPHASAAFSAAHPGSPWSWKDPRACTLMPFWDRVLGGDTPRIVVLRHPAESAASLAARAEFPRAQAMALCERSVRAAFRDSSGRPVLVTTFDELLGDIEGWCGRALEFIRGCGIDIAPDPDLGEVHAFLDESLRHHRGHEDLADDRSEPWWELWNWGLERRGAHRAFEIDGLPAESAVTGQVLAAAQRAAGAGAGPG